MRGLANVDISPELAVRLSMAWASTLEKGATVTSSRDTSRAARVLKRAIMVGCNAAGVNVDDLEAATVPVTRFQVTSSTSTAGVSVRLDPNDPQSVVLRFFDKDGIDVDETTQRKIERLYHREDFRRVLAREIGDIGFPPRTLEHYTQALVDSVDLSSARAAGLKLVLDYSYGTSSFVMPNLLAKLDADVLVVNPYANTAQAVAFDRSSSAVRVSELVRASGAHLGAVLDPGGEFVDIVDDTGHTLSHDEALLVLVTLITESVPGARIALPVAASCAAEKICHDNGAEIVWTKLSASHLMDVARSEKVTLAASQSGGFIFPSFLPAFDGAATLVNLMALLTATGRSLSEVVAQMPPVRIAHQAVHTPWDQKGMLMRTLVERSQGRRAGAGRRGQGHRGRRVGAGAARPRGAGHPRVGRGAQRRPCRGPGAEYATRLRAVAPLTRRTGRVVSWPAGAPAGGRVGSGAMNVPDDLRYSSDHEWARAAGDRVPGGDHRLRPGRPGRRRLRRPSDAGCDHRGGRDDRRGRVDQVGLGDLRPGGRRGRGRQHGPRRRSRAAQRRPVRRRAGSARSPRATRPRWTRCSTRPATGSSRKIEPGHGHVARERSVRSGYV